MVCRTSFARPEKSVATANGNVDAGRSVAVKESRLVNRWRRELGIHRFLQIKRTIRSSIFQIQGERAAGHIEGGDDQPRRHWPNRYVNGIARAKVSIEVTRVAEIDQIIVSIDSRRDWSPADTSRRRRR
jgi:protein subunit release factor B